MTKRTSEEKFIARKRRTNTIAKASKKVRILVNKTNTAMYASLIDDAKGVVLGTVSTLKMKGNPTDNAFTIGKEVATMAKNKNVEAVVFDRNGYRYQGKVAQIAAGARENGLQF